MRFGIGLVAAALLFCASCAKFPSSGGLPNDKRLVFIMQVQGTINPNYVYIVALRPSTEPNPPDTGPIPVIAPPWGNGFVAGNATHFVRWDVNQSPDYLLYAFQDPNLLQYFAIGVPIVYEDVLPGVKRIRFEIDLSQIIPAAMLDQYESIQVNFLTMDVVPQGATGSKQWDALGNSLVPSGINQYVTLSLRTSGIYNNQTFFDLEPQNDTTLPDLDIVDWSVEVRLQ